LRRSEAGEHPDPAAAPKVSLLIGLRLVRLVSEAPAGTRLRVVTRGEGARLCITIIADAPGEVDLTRSGLHTPDAAVAHLIEEAAGMLEEVAAVSNVRDSAGPESLDPPASVPADLPADLPAVRLLPRGPAEALRPTGFRLTDAVAPQSEGDWSVPRPSDPTRLSTLLLARPDLRLIQTLEPLTDAEINQARTEHADDVTRFGPADGPGALGTPIRCAAALVTADPRGTLPLRLREHLRGWFDVVDLDEMPAAEATTPVTMPEVLAGGLLRFPATVEDSFPGLPVEPVTVPFELVDPPTDGVRIGVAHDFQNRLVPVHLDDELMSRHVHIVGEPGSGKSTVLTSVAIETAARGGGLLMLDPHGTTVDRILAELPPEARERVLLIRCGDTANPVRLNPLSLTDPDLQDIVVSDMLDAFQQLFDPRHEGIVGPRFQHIMRHALSTLIYYRGQRASLLDVPRLLYDRDLLTTAVRGLDDPELKAFWVNDVINNRSSDFNEVVGWVSSKFTTFASNKAMKSMLATGEDSLDPVAAMAADRIVLVDLDKGTVGAMGARMLGLLYLLRFWVAALGRPEPRPFTMLVDEASSFSAVALPAILSEGRKFGLRAVVAHQFMTQLAPALADALEGGAATRLVFRVGPDDARDLAVSTYPEFGPLDLTSMPQFVAATRIASAGAPVRPFTLTVDHNSRVWAQPDAAEGTAKIRQRSIRELVDPFRDAVPMKQADLAEPASTRPTPPEGATGSFLDDWLRSRKQDK
jgi:hypothetical protein